MTDQIPADKVREIIATRGLRASEMIAEIESILPPPPLADMPLAERAACQWMQADTETWGRAVILRPNTLGGSAVMLDQWGHVAYEDHADVTPRPDLPRMEWPGNKKPDPAPALPDGWRVADHKENGRVIVTNPTPTRDGRVYYVLPSADPLGFDWLFCDPDELTYIDQEDDQ